MRESASSLTFNVEVSTMTSSVRGEEVEAMKLSFQFPMDHNSIVRLIDGSWSSSDELSTDNKNKYTVQDRGERSNFR